VRPQRIVEVIRRLDADVIALQEVLSIESGERAADQARFIAEELGYYSTFGQNRELRGGRYGNLLLTRFPIQVSRNHDLSKPRREPRGCLQADITVNQNLLHIFNIHLGTGLAERRYQAELLSKGRIFDHERIQGPRIVLGDFNEWTCGSVSRLLTSRFVAADVRRHLNRSRTYPGLLPFLHLDHIYFDPALRLVNLTLCLNRTALIASDHLPLVADFEIEFPRVLLN
jgi:endonuclease/exonuclease/phosphatase family metal-dependent hydrolase